QDTDAESPLVPCGDSREHRPALKPLLCGLTVKAEGRPGWGHGTDGNRRDTLEPRSPSTPLRQFLPDLEEPLLVADGKCCAGATRGLAGAPQWRLVTLLLQTVSLRQERVERPELRALPLLWEQPGRRPGQIER